VTAEDELLSRHWYSLSAKKRKENHIHTLRNSLKNPLIQSYITLNT
jgi:hypothetical protein